MCLLLFLIGTIDLYVVLYDDISVRKYNVGRFLRICFTKYIMNGNEPLKAIV